MRIKLVSIFRVGIACLPYSVIFVLCCSPLPRPHSTIPPAPPRLLWHLLRYLCCQLDDVTIWNRPAEPSRPHAQSLCPANATQPWHRREPGTLAPSTGMQLISPT